MPARRRRDGVLWSRSLIVLRTKHAHGHVWAATLCSILCFASCGTLQSQPRQAPAEQQTEASGARAVSLDGAASRSNTGGASAASVAVGAKRSLAIDGVELDTFLARGPGRVLYDIQLEPVIAAGRRFLGFRVLQIFDNSAAALRYGVRPNDIVKSVNGVPLVRPDDLLRIMTRLRDADELDVKVLRDANPVRVRIPILRQEKSDGAGTNP